MLPAQLLSVLRKPCCARVRGTRPFAQNAKERGTASWSRRRGYKPGPPAHIRGPLWVQGNSRAREQIKAIASRRAVGLSLDTRSVLGTRWAWRAATRGNI